MSAQSGNPPDMAIVDAMCRGFTPARPPTSWERLVVVRHLAKRGYTDREIGARIGRSARTVLRLRREFGIAGQPVGTNRYTRKNLT